MQYFPSFTLSGATLVKLCTHFRNLAKAGEVLGCAKVRKPTAEVRGTVENRQGQPFLVLTGSDSSTMELPLMAVPTGVKPVDVLTMFAMSAPTAAGTAGASQADLDGARRHAEALEAANAGLRADVAGMVAECKRLDSELAVARAELDMAREVLRNRAADGLDGAGAAELAEARAEAEALRRTVAKLRGQPAQARQPEPQAVATDSALAECLRMLANHPHATVQERPWGHVVEFNGAQGVGTAAILKAAGFNWTSQRVWVRKA